MEQFMITYAPILVVAFSVIGVFIWGAKGKFLENIE
ncbi:cytochrome bd oxidase small subunit CydS [Aneurinibacillus sp. REN35]